MVSRREFLVADSLSRAAGTRSWSEGWLIEQVYVLLIERMGETRSWSGDWLIEQVYVLPIERIGEDSLVERGLAR